MGIAIDVIMIKTKGSAKCDYEINSRAPSVHFKIKLIKGLTITIGLTFESEVQN